MNNILKILLSLIIVIFSENIVFSETMIPEKTNKIKFIYIHGSNTNTQKNIDNFKKQISKLHKYVTKNFNKNDVIKQKLMENGALTIDETPEAFIWGDKSAQEINMLTDLLDVSKLFSPKLAQLTRSIFAHCMHDAIWVQQYYNMSPILDDLHKEVLKEQKEGNKVVLLGYSAGTFITLRYILMYSPLINSNQFFKKYIVNLSSDVQNKMDKVNPDKTCLNAINAMDSVFLKENYKDVKIYIDENDFLKEYQNLDAITQQYCYNDETIKGVINFGSPLFLFSSSLTNPQTELGQYSQYVLAHYISKGHFWLSLNFKEDPLGFSDDNNYYSSVIENYINSNLEKDTGFVYDNSAMTANRLFITAHYAYLTRYKLFAKNMAKSFAKAYEVFYKEAQEIAEKEQTIKN